MSLPELKILVDAPDEFVPRAAWALDTMLAPLGRRARLVRERAAAGDCALAYAPAPVPGVPTIPASAAAMEVFAHDRALPPGSFTALRAPAGTAVGAWPAVGDFAVPFDLVASAFTLLACWDEHTSADRDGFGRLAYASSVFGAEPALRLEDPAVDGYVALLRSILSSRPAGGGAAPLPASGWMWGDIPGFAVALTHDLDNLWRWTPRGFAATGYRGARAVWHSDWPAFGREIGDLWRWLTVHLPRRSDPHWTFPQLLGGEDARGVTSTFFVIASHSHRRDGAQPRTYRRRIPAALDLLNRGGREVGLHGNDRDRLGVAPLDEDLRDLERRAGSAVRGVRYHYLRCLYHETLPLVDAARIAYDSSLAFAEHEGFRCGVSFPFHPYHLGAERPLDLLEVPLALMDTGLQGAQYRALGAAEAERVALEILERVRAGGGGAAILWHNVRFDRRSAQGYDDVYWRLVDQVRAEGGSATSAWDLARRWRVAMGEDLEPVREDARGGIQATSGQTSSGGTS